jgi:hypothetical protein
MQKRHGFAFSRRRNPLDLLKAGEGMLTCKIIWGVCVGRCGLDSDWIVMKALEKDRNRRYETATSLGRDIERYLGGEVVQACPPSLSYRLRKWAARHRPVVMAVAALAALLVALAGVATVVAFREQHLKREAEAKADALDHSLYYQRIALAAQRLKQAIASYYAATTTLQAKGAPSTQEGEIIEARKAMETRQEQALRTRENIINEILNETSIYLAGGDQVNGLILEAKVQDAAKSCLDRLYPEFHLADSPDWHKVIERAKKGDGDALTAVGHKGDPTSHAVCKGRVLLPVEDRLFGAHVPHLENLVLTYGGQPLTVGAKGYAHDRVSMPGIHSVPLIAAAGGTE